LGNTDDLFLVSQITPPQFDLYIEAGFYHVGMGVMNYDACFHAGLNAASGNLRAPLALAYRETEADVRAWNRKPAEVRREGALFNVFRGTPFGALGSPAVLVAWPGAGCRTAGFNFCFSSEPRDFAHTHPVSDECLILWGGRVKAYLGTPDVWLEMNALDCILAPCGVFHAPQLVEGPAFLGGFASPPQLDLAIKTEFYKDGIFLNPPSTPLECPHDQRVGLLFQR
jgi:gentisate 1,2-dioxygenase